MTQFSRLSCSALLAVIGCLLPGAKASVGDDCNNDGIPDASQLTTRLIDVSQLAVEVDAGSGALTLFSGLSFDGVGDLQCLTLDPDAGLLYGITTPGAFVSIDLATEQISVDGFIEDSIGGVAYDATTNKLYGVIRLIGTTDYYLVEIDC